jgi:hypothetical protein
MLTKSYLLLFLIFSVNLNFAQTSNTQDEFIVCASKNQVAENVMVYTFAYSTNETPTSAMEDAEFSSNNFTGEVNNILQKFKGNNEILECSFDQATSTFTVVTSSSTDLSKTVNEINLLKR